jgi:type IV pilus assembly protein PilX
MITAAYKTRFAQRGVVLVSSLLLLIVVTIIALSMFRSFGIQEKIAGNMREKQRALNAAETAQVFAELWLTNNAINGASVNCTTTLNANIGQGQICANTLTALNIDVAQPPYLVNNVPTGVTYLPMSGQANPMPISTTTSVSAANALNPSYFGLPTFYISDMGPSADASIPGEVYQVDAYAYGGSSTTVAVVESTYAVYTSSSNRTL